MIYRATLTTGRTIEIEDARTLKELASELCEVGYLIVRRVKSGYDADGLEITLFERGTACIEPAG